MNESDSSNRFELSDPDLATSLFGRQNRHLKQVEKLLDLRIGSNGAILHFQGEDCQVALAMRLFDELADLLRAGYPLYPPDIDYAIRILSADSRVHLREVFLDTIYVSARKKLLHPRVWRRRPISMPFASMMWFLGSGLLEQVRPILPWPWLLPV